LVHARTTSLSADRFVFIKLQGGDVLKYKHLYGAPNKKADTYYNLTPAVSRESGVRRDECPLCPLQQNRLEAG
jgi:hypothetical protein